jgi:hypothetical protein
MGRRVLRISDTLLLEMLRQDHEAHYRVIKDGLPADAKIINFAMEGAWTCGRGVAALLLESAEWEPSPEGKPYPDVTPTLQSLWHAQGQFVPFEEAHRQ